MTVIVETHQVLVSNVYGAYLAYRPSAASEGWTKNWVGIFWVRELHK